jgi:hypothetical protein
VWLTRKAETMTPQEASQLVELASTIWANVKNTPGTCEAWSLALAQTNFYDAKDAIGSLARERKTIHVSDIVKRAASMREALLRSLPPIPDPPVELADNLQAEVQWIRTARERQLHQARLERHAVAV